MDIVLAQIVECTCRQARTSMCGRLDSACSV